MTLPLLAVGAVGLIGVATHWCAPEARELFDAWSKGDVDLARRVNARLIESFSFETGDDAPNPQPTKALLRGIGRPAGPCRLPMGPDPDWLAARAHEVYTNLVTTRG
jgi:4-hydroxy-tetrahydrodipicolinate synthase